MLRFFFGMPVHVCFIFFGQTCACVFFYFGHGGKGKGKGGWVGDGPSILQTGRVHNNIANPSSLDRRFPDCVARQSLPMPPQITTHTPPPSFKYKLSNTLFSMFYFFAISVFSGN